MSAWSENVVRCMRVFNAMDVAELTCPRIRGLRNPGKWLQQEAAVAAGLISNRLYPLPLCSE